MPATESSPSPFPHIGNVGTNDEDIEDLNPAARAGAVGAIFKANVTRALELLPPAGHHLDHMAEERRGTSSHCPASTLRALTVLIREKACRTPSSRMRLDGVFDIDDLKAAGRSLSAA